MSESTQFDDESITRSVHELLQQIDSINKAIKEQNLLEKELGTRDVFKFRQIKKTKEQ